jgi:hypothetical protein
MAIITIKGTPVVAANEVLVADSNSKIPAVDGSAVTTMAGGNITGTIPTARLDTGTTANKVVVVGASGLPVVDGSLLTGIVSYTKSASDPTVSTNPATGVGTEWVNHTTGKQFICTDATAGANVWKASGGGSGDVVPWEFGGTSYGYSAGGYPPADWDVIHKFSLSSDANATNIGDLSLARHAVSGNSGSSYGYAAGGNPDPVINVVDKFAFATDGNAVDNGDLTAGRAYMTTQSSETYGYCSGGVDSSPTPAAQNIIDKFPFASSANSTDVGDLATAIGRGFGHSSTTHGYSAVSSAVNKFSFSSDGNATDVGALSDARNYGSGNSSATHGYSAGGFAPDVDVIDKYSFATEGTASDVGNLTTSRGQASGQSSTTYGYNTGGVIGSTAQNTIDKFPFASDTNATDVADIPTAIRLSAGSQY